MPIEIKPNNNIRPQITADVRHGAGLLLVDLGYAPLHEFRIKLAAKTNSRYADICGINDKGEIIIIEVKSSYEDYRADNKWPEYAEYCDDFYFAIDKTFPQNIIPDNIGIIIADKYGGMILRHTEPHKLSPARRKTITLSFARQAAFKAANILGQG